jgi:hypothetical protein
MAYIALPTIVLLFSIGAGLAVGQVSGRSGQTAQEDDHICDALAADVRRAVKQAEALHLSICFYLSG